jgi:acyl-CoA thioesterase-1
MRNRLIKSSIMALLATLNLAPATAMAQASVCPRAPLQSLALPHLRAALSAHEPAVIVALGSSSTQGAMASNTGDSYPAELQDFLAAALPTDEISVINKGIGGEDARREDARMAHDVLALHPQMVIWQVGANAAARNETPAQFAKLVQAGLLRLKNGNADIVLMDNQRSRILLASKVNKQIDAALARLARRDHVGLFSRDVLMRAWTKSGVSLDTMLAPDGLHMNDAGYTCLAQALSRSIVEAVKPPVKLQRASKAAEAGLVKPK